MYVCMYISKMIFSVRMDGQLFAAWVIFRPRFRVGVRVVYGKQRNYILFSIHEDGNIIET